MKQSSKHTLSMSRVISDYVPFTIGAALTGFLIWSFIISPYVSTPLEVEESQAQEEAKHEFTTERRPLSFRNPHKAEESASSYSHQTDFVPERTDLQSLLNKSISIDPLLNTSFSLGEKVSNWDDIRSKHREGTDSKNPKVFMLTGSQPTACMNLVGDHMLVVSIKNKIDYCRLHGMEMFYNVARFTDDMPSWWVKLPLIRSFMLSRPDIEWFWWIDSDAVFTDMSFTIPWERYADHNMVLHGWESLIYAERKWTGLNMGIFLVRNCQWTLDLFDTLAPMGYKGIVGDRIGKVLTMALSGRPENFESDDQGAFIYLLNAERERWGAKVYLENSYYLNGYWKDLVDKYEEFEKGSRESWPFVTHFTGCQICSGKINPMYSAEECTRQMDRALRFADNQVLNGIGYVHPDLSTHEIVRKNSDSSD